MNGWLPIISVLCRAATVLVYHVDDGILKMECAYVDAASAARLRDPKANIPVLTASEFLLRLVWEQHPGSRV